MYRRICRKKLKFFVSESISKKVFKKYFAILLKSQENKEKYQKPFFSSVTRHLDRYLQEERTVFSYKGQTSHEFASPKRLYRISQRHMP